MHVTCSLLQGAGTAKYMLPVSDTSCVVTSRIMLVQDVLYQSSLVLFLLAKVYVTNGNRVLTCWEKGVLWWSRLYAVVYLPLVALAVATTFVSTANPAGTFCLGAATASQARALGIGTTMLIAQFVLLLGLFMKPMLVRLEGSQSGGALYRRMVVRNIICTSGIVISYVATSVIMLTTIFRESPTNGKAAQIRYSVVGINAFGTLCLTEITLPLGFGSCLATCRKTTSEGQSATSQAGGRTTKPGKSLAGNITTITKVVPVQMPLPPHTP